jgi:hypothetical protein
MAQSGAALVSAAKEKIAQFRRQNLITPRPLS